MATNQAPITGRGASKTPMHDISFPGEEALGHAIREHDHQQAQDYDRLNAAVNGGVRAWLREQGVDPDNIPADWGK